MLYTPQNTMGKDVRVFLNGEEVKHVAEADDEAGFVVLFPKDAEGRFIVRGEELVRERLEGDVRVEVKTPRSVEDWLARWRR